MMGRGNIAEVYPLFGQDIRNGILLAIENYAVNNMFMTVDYFARYVDFYRDCYAHYGHGSRSGAIVGAGTTLYVRTHSQTRTASTPHCGDQPPFPRPAGARRHDELV